MLTREANELRIIEFNVINERLGFMEARQRFNFSRCRSCKFFLFVSSRLLGIETDLFDCDNSHS
jgi:hypothetical protein